MIVIIGLVILLAAVLIAVVAVATNTGGTHSVGDHFAILGHPLTGMSTGRLFLDAIAGMPQSPRRPLRPGPDRPALQVPAPPSTTLPPVGLRSAPVSGSGSAIPRIADMTATKSFRFRTTRRSRLFSSGGPNVMLRRIVPIVYLLIGALVASQH